MTENTSILVIYTGGTIGMIQNAEGALVPFNFDNIYKQIPVLKQFHFKIDSISFDPLIDSSDMSPELWIELATLIKSNYEQYDGFVILHGTDTMSYTASALSFMLENLSKPVVLTGSQLPLGMLRTDGRENFITAIEIAASYEDETAIVPEVCIYFENTLFRGNRTTKFNAEDFDAFISPNYPPLAEAGIHLKFNKAKISNSKFKKLKIHTALNQDICVLKLFPGIRQEIVDSILETQDLKAIIIEAYGSGNTPTTEWFTQSIRNAAERGVIIFVVSQCKKGAVDIGKYQASMHLRHENIVGGADISIESAISKLMVLLGSNQEHSEILKKLKRSLRGELTIEA